MTKYLVSGYIGFDNFGDEAIAKVLIENLTNLKPEKITVLSSNPDKTSKLYNVNSKHFLKFLKPVIEADVLISGGGSLLQDITSLKSLVYYLLVIVSALVFNKKVIIFAQGFTPFRTKIGRILTKFVLKNCHEIYVRDVNSQIFLESLGLKSKVVSDPVFGIKVQEKGRSGVGIQLRDFNSVTDEFLEKLAVGISKNFENQEIKLFSLQDNIDLEVLKNFQTKLARKGVKSIVYQNLSVEETLDKISSLEYLIGMRFHSLLVAVKSKVKVLGINYDIKVSNLSNSVGFPLIDLNQPNLEKGFEELFGLDITKYEIPEFEFPLK